MTKVFDMHVEGLKDENNDSHITIKCECHCDTLERMLVLNSIVSAMEFDRSEFLTFCAAYMSGMFNSSSENVKIKLPFKEDEDNES